MTEDRGDVDGGDEFSEVLRAHLDAHASSLRVPSPESWSVEQRARRHVRRMRLRVAAGAAVVVVAIVALGTSLIPGGSDTRLEMIGTPGVGDTLTIDRELLDTTGLSGNLWHVAGTDAGFYGVDVSPGTITAGVAPSADVERDFRLVRSDDGQTWRDGGAPIQRGDQIDGVAVRAQAVVAWGRTDTKDGFVVVQVDARWSRYELGGAEVDGATVLPDGSVHLVAWINSAADLRQAEATRVLAEAVAERYGPDARVVTQAPSGGGTVEIEFADDSRRWVTVSELGISADTAADLFSWVDGAMTSDRSVLVIDEDGLAEVPLPFRRSTMSSLTAHVAGDVVFARADDDSPAWWLVAQGHWEPVPPGLVEGETMQVQHSDLGTFALVQARANDEEIPFSTTTHLYALDSSTQTWTEVASTRSFEPHIDDAWSTGMLAVDDHHVVVNLQKWALPARVTDPGGETTDETTQAPSEGVVRLYVSTDGSTFAHSETPLQVVVLGPVALALGAQDQADQMAPRLYRLTFPT